MAVQVAWDDSGRVPEKSIIYWTFAGTWNWDEFAEVDEIAYEMSVGMMPAIIDVIVDMTGSGRTPFTGAIGYFTRSLRRNPSNRGIVVIVGARGVLRSLEAILRRLNPKTSQAYLLVATLEEAYHLIEERRQQRSPDKSLT